LGEATHKKYGLRGLRVTLISTFIIRLILEFTLGKLDGSDILRQQASPSSLVFADLPKLKERVEPTSVKAKGKASTL
jgi:hypothetical protein